MHPVAIINYLAQVVNTSAVSTIVPVKEIADNPLFCSCYADNYHHFLFIAVFISSRGITHIIDILISQGLILTPPTLSVKLILGRC